MLKDIKLKNPKSVSFNVRSFCPAVKRTRTHKHVIYPNLNVGFTARPGCLRGSTHGVRRVTMPSSIGLDTVAMRTINTIDGSSVKRVFCYSTRQENLFTTAMISVTDNGAYFTLLFGGFPTSALPNDFKDADCFETGYTRGRYYVFAVNKNGLYAATNSLWFEPVRIDGSPYSLKVLDGRLFVLDKDLRTIHFSAPLDMLDFDASKGFAGSIQADESLGAVQEIKEYGGKLLLVHKSGFSTLEPAYDPQKFVIKPICNSHKEIIPNTTQALGSTVYFLTKEGMCVLENGKVRLLDIDASFAPIQTNAVSFVYDNNYYLAYRSGTAEEANNTVLVIEKFFDSWTIIKNTCVRAFEKIWNPHSACLGILTDDLVNVYRLDAPNGAEVPTVMKWESDWFALTYAATVQFVKQVLIKTAHPVTLVITNNRGEQRLHINGNPDVQKMNLNMKGEMFKISLESETCETDISSLTVVVGFNTGAG